MPVTPEAPATVTVLAFDFGLRRIGAAVGQSVTESASPLSPLDCDDGAADLDAIADYVREWSPTCLVVGLPLHADGRRSDLQPMIDAFVADLARFDKPVHLVDERYSSLEAERTLTEARARGSRRRLSKGEIDSAAAVVIAQRFLAAGSGGSV